MFQELFKLFTAVRVGLLPHKERRGLLRES